MIVSCLACVPTNEQNTKPNILLIVADDLGYADLGCYGGDIETPNLDELAKRGTRFSQFHTAPYCAVTRAMLLTGNNSHVAGMGSQSLVTGVAGYEGKLSDRIVTIPQLLKDAGYHTYMTGKWHLGLTPDANPSRKGFEHSFALLEGAGNHYTNVGFDPEHPESPYTENGEKIVWKDGSYSTDVYTNKMISYIEANKEDKKPFFGYVAYTSPHWPLQVDEQFWKKYQGRYDEGYDVLKIKRLESLKQAGIIPGDATLPANHPRVKPWDSLSAEEQKNESRKMELYAGMVDNLDYNIGRLINFLKENDLYKNTIIVFISDNGAAAEDFYNHPYFAPFIRQHYTNHYDSMGQHQSFVSYGPQWAEAGSSPFRYFKGMTTEGGITAPMIIAGRGVSETNKIKHSFTSLLDIAPTFYEAAGVSYPEQYQEKAVYPLLGRSLNPVLTGIEERIHPTDYVFGLEHRGHAMIRKGEWKLVNHILPFDTANFELYNLSKDLGEQQNLKNQLPEKYNELKNEWLKFSLQVGVKNPTPNSGEEL